MTDTFDGIGSPLAHAGPSPAMRADALRRDLDRKDPAEAAQQMEALFATMLVKELRRSLPDGFFSGSGSDVYGSWFDQHVGEALSERNALGLAGLIKTSMAQAQVAEEQTP